MHTDREQGGRGKEQEPSEENPSCRVDDYITIVVGMLVGWVPTFAWCAR